MENEKNSTNSRSSSWWIAAGLAAFLAWITGEARKTPRNLFRADVNFEASDINAKYVVIVGFGVLVFAVVASITLYPVFEHFLGVHAKENPPAPPEVTLRVTMPPEPRVQDNPRQDLGDYLARQKFELHRYSVVNRHSGAVTIPIECAMDLLVQRGIPPQKQPPPNMFYEPRAGTRLTGLEGEVEPEPR